jgi:RHS repeat-associated protein
MTTMKNSMIRVLLIGLPVFAVVSADASAAVGRTNGSFAVSPTGAATYQIPLWVSPGAGGVQPSLTLTYDSQNGGGIVGPGWSLAGLSAITRCNKTVAQDTTPAPVTLSYSDVFCLDGKRLRQTLGSPGTYGQPTTQYQTELADFTQVTALGVSGNGPGGFDAKGKNGLYYQFGRSMDSAIRPSATNFTINMWLLNKVSDRAGNSYSVTYGTGADGSVGIGVPTRIDYSPTSAGATTYLNYVTFEYGPKAQQVPGTTDPAIVGYINGEQVVNTNLLLAVNVYSESNLVRRYKLDYEASPATTRARLWKVTECASADMSNCLAPTVIAYQNGGTGVASSSIAAGNGNFLGAPDVDGDGRQDVMFADAGGVKVARSIESGFASAVSVSTVSGQWVSIGDVSGTGKDEIILPVSGSWRRFTWNGSGFTSSTTGLTVPANTIKSALTDVDGDGRVDLVAITRTFNNSTRVFSFNVHTWLNKTAAGAVTFQAQTVYPRSVSCFGTQGSIYPCDADIKTGWESRSGTTSLDFNGDGRKELLLATLIPNLAAGESRPSVRRLTWTGSTYSQDSASYIDEYDIVGFANFNDDACTDTVFVTGLVGIARCGGQGGGSVWAPGSAGTTIDWNGDGRTDILVQNGTNFGVAISSGSQALAVTATTIPIGSGLRNAFAIDQDGDGLQDLGVMGSSGIVVYRHASPGVRPDLVTSITDGLGVNVSPSYVSLPRGSYTKGTGATYPQRDYIGPLHVVSSLTASSGASNGGPSTYSTTYTYFSARTDVNGRGFGGFDRVRTQDGRSGIIRDVYRRTAFPYTGMVYREDVYQPDGTTVISRDDMVLNKKDLDLTANNQRYFPYVDLSTTESREVDLNQQSPNLNGTLIKTTEVDLTYDDYGNVMTFKTTTTDSLPGSPQFGRQWKSTIVKTVTPNTGTWCLSPASQMTVTNEAPDKPTLVRTTSYSVDAANCRLDSETVQPGDAKWQVTTAFHYDAFGNIDQITVTPAAGQGQGARTTSINWGATGRYAETVTNAASEPRTIGWNHALGKRTSDTDANGLITGWQIDPFGRVTRESLPDGTATDYTLTACDASNAECGLAGSRTKVDVTYRGAGNVEIRTDTQLSDLFNRPRRAIRQLLGGTSSQTTLSYDVRGQLASKTIPHAPGATAYMVNYTYDLIGRPTLIRRPTSAEDLTDNDTSVDYQGATIIKTDELERVTRQRFDPLGRLVQAFDALGSDIDFEYNAFGNVLSSTDVQGNQVVMTYNIRGMKLSTSDPDLGTWSYDYFPLGELKSQTDAKNQTVTFEYDALSRPRFRYEAEGTTEWIWGSSAAAHNVGKLDTVTSPGYSETLSYDGMSRVSRRRIVNDGTYDYNYTYHAVTGQLGTMTYPTSTSGFRLGLEYVYERGALSEVKDAAGTIYWKAREVDAFGHVTDELLGNGVVTSRQFDAVTGQVSRVLSTYGVDTILQNESYLFDEVGNLEQRQKYNSNQIELTENFHYDALDRLEYSELNGAENLRLTYSPIGNIQTRSDIASGATWTYDTTKKHAVRQAGTNTYSYDANGNATLRNGFEIKWTSYNYAYEVNGPNKKLTFSYGPDRQRYRQQYVNAGVTETTMYVGGMLEKVTANGVDDYRHYITANGDTVAIVSRRSDGTNATRYMLEDSLGSVVGIAGSNGSPIVTESFDAFGRRRDAETWDGACACPTLAQIASISRRGYTGHEMVGGQSMGLVHMNGRIMDSTIGRFLSADPIVQFPDVTQSYNRYSYVMNNPLTFTDPTGFEVIAPWPWNPIWGPWPPNFAPCTVAIGPPCEPFDTPEYDGAPSAGGGDQNGGAAIGPLDRPPVAPPSPIMDEIAKDVEQAKQEIDQMVKKALEKSDVPNLPRCERSLPEKCKRVTNEISRLPDREWAEPIGDAVFIRFELVLEGDSDTSVNAGYSVRRSPRGPKVGLNLGANLDAKAKVVGHYEQRYQNWRQYQSRTFEQWECEIPNCHGDRFWERTKVVPQGEPFKDGDVYTLPFTRDSATYDVSVPIPGIKGNVRP